VGGPLLTTLTVAKHSGNETKKTSISKLEQRLGRLRFLRGQTSVVIYGRLTPGWVVRARKNNPGQRPGRGNSGGGGGVVKAAWRWNFVEKKMFVRLNTTSHGAFHDQGAQLIASGAFQGVFTQDTQEHRAGVQRTGGTGKGSWRVFQGGPL